MMKLYGKYFSKKHSKREAKLEHTTFKEHPYIKMQRIIERQR